MTVYMVYQFRVNTKSKLKYGSNFSSFCRVVWSILRKMLNVLSLNNRAYLPTSNTSNSDFSEIIGMHG